MHRVKHIEQPLGFWAQLPVVAGQQRHGQQVSQIIQQDQPSAGLQPEDLSVPHAVPEQLEHGDPGGQEQEAASLIRHIIEHDHEADTPRIVVRVQEPAQCDGRRCRDHPCRKRRHSPLFYPCGGINGKRRQKHGKDYIGGSRFQCIVKQKLKRRLGQQREQPQPEQMLCAAGGLSAGFRGKPGKYRECRAPDHQHYNPDGPFCFHAHHGCQGSGYQYSLYRMIRQHGKKRDHLQSKL